MKGRRTVASTFRPTVICLEERLTPSGNDPIAQNLIGYAGKYYQAAGRYVEQLIQVDQSLHQIEDQCQQNPANCSVEGVPALLKEARQIIADEKTVAKYMGLVEKWAETYKPYFDQDEYLTFQENDHNFHVQDNWIKAEEQSYISHMTTWLNQALNPSPSPSPSPSPCPSPMP